jgi:hypothetical protein
MVSSRWIFKIKHIVDGSIQKYNASSWREGSPKRREWTMRRHLLQSPIILLSEAIISIDLEMGWRIHQMDVKTTFLNGVIEEEVYIEQLRDLRCMGEILMFVD